MKKNYNPKDLEQPIYKYWEKSGFFKPNFKKKKKYCIIMPPPNITGNLHIGHAFQQTIMDILIRYNRMQGKNTLWQVGTDHAGIATQIIVNNKLYYKYGKNKKKYNRNIFLKKIWDWKSKSCNKINNQMRRLGSSVYWDNERFTLDKEFSKSVKKAFIKLYNENLIYKSKKLVNWDIKLCTAISSIEVENKFSKSYMWYLRYPIVGKKKNIDYLLVATTRPETILGDTALAINPDHPKYQNLIGKYVIIPLINRHIPIISDKYADINKGTGCVKITPAHDFNDYEIGKRHKLMMINIFTLDGKIKNKADLFDSNGNFILNFNLPKKFQGLDRFSARNKILKELNKFGFLYKVKSHNLIIPYGDRSGVIIEPMLTDQWYMRTSLLAKPAIKAVKSGKIKFISKKYENIYFNWMYNIQEWCISRQIWWGHRIPAWYDKNNKIYVGINEKDIRKKYNLIDNIKLYQDNDVLDTWFSSALWTFSSLGWPKKTKFLKKFHPTNVIISGFDIIFFWIAKMIMLTMHFIKDKNGKPQIPFKNVYITGLIRDKTGKKMSKSKGNIIDPLHIIDGISFIELLKKKTQNIIKTNLLNKIKQNTKKEFPNGIKAYGTDAMRFTLSSIAHNGQNINLDINRLEGYRNFCNKLWNASRFILINTKDCYLKNIKSILSLPDKWIIYELNKTIKNFRDYLDNYRFDLASNILYKFIWNKFCDWYLEFTKIIINFGTTSEIIGTKKNMLNILEIILRLAHPIIPFITESIWQKIFFYKNSIMIEKFPNYNLNLNVNNNDYNNLLFIKKIIIAIRKTRIDMNISLRKPLNLIFKKNNFQLIKIIKSNLNLIINIAYIKNIMFCSKIDKIPISVTKIINGIEMFIQISDVIDKQFVINKFKKEIEIIDTKINYIQNKLNNINFINKAPDSIIKKNQQNLNNYQQNKKKLIKQKKNINNI